MNDYNYLTYSQEQLNRAIEVLNENPNRNNYTEEAKLALEILARTKPIYKKAYGTGEFVKVGKLTAKNEILFDKPKTYLYSITKNLSRSSNVYHAGWFLLTDLEKTDETKGHLKTKREDYYSYYEIVNRQMFNEILYDENKYTDKIDLIDCPVLGFMMGDYRTAEVVFYDQYID